MEPLRRLLIVGPGLVFALGSIGPRDLITNSIAGSTSGLGLLWVLAVAIGARYVVLDASARYVLVTGETLLTGCGRLGRWPVLGIFGAALIRRHVAALTKVLLLGTAAHIVLPLPTPHSVAIWGVVSWFAGFAVLFWGRYALVEKVSKPLAALIGGSMALIVVLSHPDLGRLASSAVPRLPPPEPGLHSPAIVIMAVLAAAMGSFGNLNYSAYMHEKGWRSMGLQRSQRFDLAVCMVALFLFLALIQVAAAAVLGPRGLRVDKVEDLAAIFSQILGDPGRVLFGVILWGASFSSYVGQGSGQGIMLSDVYHRFVSRSLEINDKEQAVGQLPAYRWSVLFMFLSPVYVFMTNWTPVGLVLVYGMLSVATLPVMSIVILLLTYDRKRMGEHANSLWTNLILALTVLCALFLTYQGVIDVLKDLRKG